MFARVTFILARCSGSARQPNEHIDKPQHISCWTTTTGVRSVKRPVACAPYRFVLFCIYVYLNLILLTLRESYVFACVSSYPFNIYIYTENLYMRFKLFSIYTNLNLVLINETTRICSVCAKSISWLRVLQHLLTSSLVIISAID